MPQSGQAFGREFCWGLLNTQKWQQVQEVSWTENSWEIGREYREHTICACLVPSFPGDPLITQNTSPGEPLVWPSRAAVIISFSVICLFFFFPRIQFALLSFLWFVSGAQSNQHGLILDLGLVFFFFSNMKKLPSCSLNLLPAISFWWFVLLPPCTHLPHLL